MRVSCQECGKPTWAGCGGHIEAALRAVPKNQRCVCFPGPQASRPCGGEDDGMWSTGSFLFIVAAVFGLWYFTGHDKSEPEDVEYFRKIRRNGGELQDDVWIDPDDDNVIRRVGRRRLSRRRIAAKRAARTRARKKRNAKGRYT